MEKMEQIQTKKRWQDLSAPSKVGTVVTSILQVGLLVAALWDIRKREAEEINGSKKMWLPFLFVNFIGPIAYFWRGVKRSSS